MRIISIRWILDPSLKSGITWTSGGLSGKGFSYEFYLTSIKLGVLFCEEKEKKRYLERAILRKAILRKTEKENRTIKNVIKRKLIVK